jgi:hypothetical protein
MICVNLCPQAPQLSVPFLRGSDVESYSLWFFHPGDSLFRLSTLIRKTLTLYILLKNVPKRPQPIPISKSSCLISSYVTCAVHMGLLHNLINHGAFGGLLKALKIDQISFNYSGLFGIKASSYSSLEIHSPAECYVIFTSELGYSNYQNLMGS